MCWGPNCGFEAVTFPNEKDSNMFSLAWVPGWHSANSFWFSGWKNSQTRGLESAWQCSGTVQQLASRGPLCGKMSNSRKTLVSTAGMRQQHALIKPLACNLNKANLVSYYMTIYSHERMTNCHILKPMFRVSSLNTALFSLQLVDTARCAMDTANHVSTLIWGCYESITATTERNKDDHALVSGKHASSAQRDRLIEEGRGTDTINNYTYTTAGAKKVSNCKPVMFERMHVPHPV